MRWIPVLMVVGCGGSFCERTAHFAEECGEEVAKEDLDECEEILQDCDAKDQKILGDYMDCLEDAGLFTCEPETVEIDDEAFLGCVTEITDLSEPCLASFVTYDVSDDRSGSGGPPPE